ncbi:uncharacterized protein [Coffea arabica]|uniref:Uncharacterized protein LOC113723725 n=1 Tax=Coffea arabica TaxID=13443 RepID=A0A6P6W2Z2_COFAR|nr:uncharacterized protein LOC113723725 [Coffea arabica]XP_027109713.1 uncharacterized protein LOC113729654 [Coffea arabica]
MDGERKKRKMDDAEAEEDNEEEKMETFFALIRSTRDIRERMVMSNADRLRLEEDQKKRANHDQNKPSAVWNPTFQPGDFMEDQPAQKELCTPPPPPPPGMIINQEEAGPSNSRKEADVAQDQDDHKAGGEHHHDLDLNLSL